MKTNPLHSALQFLVLSFVACLNLTQCSVAPTAIKAYSGPTRPASELAEIVTTTQTKGGVGSLEGMTLSPTILLVDGIPYQEVRSGVTQPGCDKAHVLPGRHRITAGVANKLLAAFSLASKTKVSSPQIPGQLTMNVKRPNGESVTIGFMDPRVDEEMENIKRQTTRTLTLDVKAGQKYVIAADLDKNYKPAGKGIYIEQQPQ